MAFGIDDAVAAVASIGGKIIDRVWPDPVQAAQAKVELLKMQQTGELAQLTAETDLAKGQEAINVEEAKSTSLFIAGWRPFVGWTCGISFGVQFVFGPLGTWTAALAGHPTVFPQMDMTQLLPVLFGILGLGSLRTYEKKQGVEGNR